MNKINDGGPAFPATWANDSDLNAIAPNGQVCPPFSSIPLPGMSLRDYFAGQALNGALAHSAVEVCDDEDADMLASAVYCIADAMLKARGQ
ncbi:hypothetical protein L0Z36_05365 [Burkholderia multivorans]|uniref:hypothetical protein n=1 Tax=Burkholderia multivorans TaxID=87883 RepID=UPI00201854F3|nr:hypothetical protein [Burkholderia multivorans]UQP01363.1 hypothetical protein L0Z36_05365 [Burkholderia multivorans]